MLFEKYARVKDSTEFARMINSGLYLCNIFFMTDKDNIVKDGFQFGFYNKEKDLISSIKLLNSISVIPDQEIAKQNYDQIPELKMEEVKIDFEQADKIMSKAVFEKFLTEFPTRKMVLLQAGPVYQCSWSCVSGNIITTIISAVDGKVEKMSTFNVRELIHKK